MTTYRTMIENIVKDLAELTALVELHKVDELQVCHNGLTRAQEELETVADWVRYQTQQLGLDF